MRLNEEQRRRLVVDHEDGFKRTELAERYGISLRTVFRILADYEARKTIGRKTRRKPGRLEKKNVPLKPCGTNAAYNRHIRKGELACDPCLAAHAAEQKRWSKKE